MTTQKTAIYISIAVMSTSNLRNSIVVEMLYFNVFGNQATYITSIVVASSVHPNMTFLLNLNIVHILKSSHF
jgi:exosortase/archaeosortase